MALTRKLLKGLGLTDEQQETILDAHTSTLAEIRDERDQYKADAEKLPTVQKQLDDTRAELDAAKQGGAEREKLQADYDKLKADFDAYKLDTETKAKEAAAREKFTELLTDMKVSKKGIAQILKWQGVSGVELDEAGKIKDVAKLKKSVSEDWADYIETDTTQGAETVTPPVSSGAKPAMTRDEIMKIPDATARQKAISENLGLFGY